MRCVICGNATTLWIYKEIISDDLAKSWKLSPSQKRKFNLRESQFCPTCKNSFRIRALTEAIVKIFSFGGVNYLGEWVEKAGKSGLRVAEINTCGNLHKSLNGLDGFVYSEYFPKLSEGSLLLKLRRLWHRLRHNVIHQDITRLTYASEIFDLVIHSDTLEHIQYVDKAIKECFRIIRPGGWCLFTVPIIPTRKTIICAKYIKNTKIKYLKPPSYHGTGNMSDYLVWREFGGDFIQKNMLKVIISYPASMTWVLGFKKDQQNK